MVVGVRVTRGPDWNLGDQDGGRNHVGTVVSINSNTSVTVQWDKGGKTRCRVGENGNHDILVLDSKPAGITHPGVECVRCEDGAIVGIRWKCTNCKNANLCTSCYNSDAHLTNHEFARITYPGAEPASVTKRSVSQRARALGTYTHAEVVKGPDWIYGSTDGGDGKPGTVEETKVTGKNQGCRTVVRVKWGTGSIGEYRLGHEGKVDLVCVEEAAGTDFYPDHLAYLDVEGLTRAVELQQKPKTSSDLAVGDKVCVVVTTSQLRQLQGGRGFTRQITGEVGIVKKLTNGGEAEVTFNDDTLTVICTALKKLHTYSKGDEVRVVDSRDKVQMLQTARGGWTESMSQAIGKIGKVTMIDEDGDLVVNFAGKKHVFHPACLEPATEGTSDKPRRVITKPGPSSTSPATPPLQPRANKPVVPPKPQTQGGTDGSANKPARDYQADLEMSSDELPRGDDFYHKDSNKATNSKPDFSSSFDGLAMLKALIAGSQNVKESFLTAVIKGDESKVKQLVALDKSLVNIDLKGISCVTIATNQGHVGILGVLVAAGADMNIKDPNGNTAIMLALSEQKGDIARVLIEKGADMNLSGQKGLYPLHLAVHKNMTGHMRLMLKKGANPNVKDEHGDTPLHDAIFIKNDTAAEVLIEDTRLNVYMTNKKNFTTLAFACLKEHTRSVEKLMDREPNLANVRMDGDCYCPLHICAVNNHVAEARILFNKGRPNVDAKNKNQLAPLHLAAMCTHVGMSRLLVAQNADVSAKDADGDTPMHLALRGRDGSVDPLMVLLGLQDDDKVNEKFTIAKVLIEKGANVDAPNKAGLTPITSCTHLRLREAVRKCATEHAANTRGTQVRASSPRGQGSGGIQSDRKCSACSSNIADTCFLPCRHQYACKACAGNYKRCPICRNDIDHVLDLRSGRVNEQVECKVQ